MKKSAALGLTFAALLMTSAAPPADYSVLIHGGMIYDGTGRDRDRYFYRYAGCNSHGNRYADGNTGWTGIRKQRGNVYYAWRVRRPLPVEHHRYGRTDPDQHGPRHAVQLGASTAG